MDKLHNRYHYDFSYLYSSIKKSSMMKLYFIPTLAALMMGSSITAQNDISSNEQGIALSGYDVVAYYETNSALRGNRDHQLEYTGATYYFTSEEHKQAFEQNPEKYLPQYGGYCAFAMAMQGAKVPADPKTFKLRDGKLYLFFNDYHEGLPFNTIVPWNADEQNLLQKAQANWEKL